MIYKAVLARENKHYYGQPFRTFKERFYGRNQAKAESTTLSKFVCRRGAK